MEKSVDLGGSRADNTPHGRVPKRRHALHALPFAWWVRRREAVARRAVGRRERHETLRTLRSRNRAQKRARRTRNYAPRALRDMLQLLDSPPPKARVPHRNPRNHWSSLLDFLAVSHAPAVLDVPFKFLKETVCSYALYLSPHSPGITCGRVIPGTQMPRRCTLPRPAL